MTWWYRNRTFNAFNQPQLNSHESLEIVETGFLVPLHLSNHLLVLFPPPSVCDRIGILSWDSQRLVLDLAEFSWRDLVCLARGSFFLGCVAYRSPLPWLVTNVVQVSNLVVPVEIAVPISHRLDRVVDPRDTDPLATEHVRQEVLIGEHPAGDLFLVGDGGGGEEGTYTVGVGSVWGEDDETRVEKGVSAW